MGRLTVAVLLALSVVTLGCTASQSPKPPPVSQEAPYRFDSARWKSAPKSKRPYDLAVQVRDRDLAKSMSLEQVSQLLGPWEIEGIPLDYSKTGGSAGVGYQLEGGGALMIHFIDGSVTNSEIIGRK